MPHREWPADDYAIGSHIQEKIAEPYLRDNYCRQYYQGEYRFELAIYKITAVKCMTRNFR